MRSLITDADWSDQGRRLAAWLNPVVTFPVAPLETFAALTHRARR